MTTGQEPSGSSRDRSAWATSRAIFHGVRAGKYRLAARTYPEQERVLLEVAEINSRRVSDLLSRPIDGPADEELV